MSRWLSLASMPLVAVLVTATTATAAPPAPGAAIGTITVDGKSVPLTHAVAFNAGAVIHLLVTDQAMPPDQVKSEFQLAMYRFQHKVVGLEFMLDSEHKVKDTSYLWAQGKKQCPGCFEVTISGGAEGPLTGTVKSTASASATEKLKVEATFNARFARASAGKD